MAVSDWSSLLSAVQSGCARSDTTFNNQVEQFVANAEERIFRGVGLPNDPLYSEAIRVPEMLTDTTLAFTDGEATTPSGWLDFHRFSRASDQVGIDFMSPDALALRIADTDSGNPRWMAIEGNTVMFGPDGYTGDIEIVHYAKPTGISENNTTNAVLTAYPTLYLEGTLFEAYTWMRDGTAAQTHLAKFRSIASGIMAHCAPRPLQRRQGHRTQPAQHRQYLACEILCLS